VPFYQTLASAVFQNALFSLNDCSLSTRLSVFVPSKERLRNMIRSLSISHLTARYHNTMNTTLFRTKMKLNFKISQQTKVSSRKR